MQGLLLHEEGTTRPLLHNLFGDCLVVGHIRVAINLVLKMLAVSHLRKDPRLQDAILALDAIKGVLRDAGLAERLAQAMRTASQDMNILVPGEIRPPPAELKFNRVRMFEYIDAAETENEVIQSVDMLFDTYDTDASSMLAGADYD